MDMNQTTTLGLAAVGLVAMVGGVVRVTVIDMGRTPNARATNHAMIVGLVGLALAAATIPQLLSPSTPHTTPVAAKLDR